MSQFNKIAIIGVGLIGGSIGLAVKKRALAKEVIGVFRHRSTLKRALQFKAVDKGVLDIREGVEDADLVIIATPVCSIPKIASRTARHANDGVIITDVGSTKRWVVDEIEKRLKDPSTASFVGSHPMAGSERAGVEAAKADLFEKSPCIVTRTDNTDDLALKKVVDFWKALGAKVKVMDPSSHDKTVAFISHLPHLIAFTLVGAVQEDDLAYAAEGFRDTTRVASSDPSIWSDIFLTNRKEMLKAGRVFERYYKRILGLISKSRHSEVAKLLGDIKAKRDKLIYGR